VAVNKMDLVDYSEAVFERIRAEFTDYAARLQAPDIHFIPISALNGDNVVRKSTRMPWFDDSCLLHYLETVHIASDRNMTEFRFPVQMVVRPDLNFRGYAGQVASGVIKPGDAVMALPSGRISRVRSIVTYDGELPRAFPPMSVTLVLEDEIDISRGDMLVPPSHPPRVARKIDARIVWMQEQPLEPGREYLLKHTTQTLRATVEAVRYRVNIDTLDKEPAGSLGLNDIGAVVIETRKPLFSDPYRRNRATGSFVLIDPMSNATVAAGMITGRAPDGAGREEMPADASGRRLTRGERQSRAGHRAATVWLEAAEAAYGLERMLFDAGCQVHALESGAGVAEIARALNDAGVIAIIHGAGDAALLERTRLAVGAESFIESALETQAVRRLLEERGFLFGFSQGV
jgi:sulfate adenylyltransferase subunit 1 (EFTu-like GTPase family)